jgi:hypothetical protein
MCEEYVCALEVSMNNLDVMQGFQTPRSLYEDFPDVILIYQLVVLLMLLDELEHIAAISILHHDTKRMKGRANLP